MKNFATNCTPLRWAGKDNVGGPNVKVWSGAGLVLVLVLVLVLRRRRCRRHRRDRRRHRLRRIVIIIVVDVVVVFLTRSMKNFATNCTALR